MRPPPRLSYCYTPVPYPKDADPPPKEQVLSKRKLSGRSPHELRRLVLESNVVSSAAGSAMVEIGHTKVLCVVTGPVTAACPQVPSSLPLDMDEGTLYVDVKYSPATGYPEEKVETVSSIEPNQQQHNNSNSSKLHSFLTRRELDLSARVLSALQAAVPLRPYPKCAIVLQLTVFQDDGCVLPACVTAASLALVQANIEIYDVVTACSVAVFLPTDTTNNNNNKTTVILADPTLDETNHADCVVTLALLPNWKEVTVWEQSGTAFLSPSVTNEAVNLCRDGCRTMHKFLREHWLEQQQPPPPTAPPPTAAGTGETTCEDAIMDETN